MAVLMNQGRPKQTRMSKTFDPTALDTAISPYLTMRDLHKTYIIIVEEKFLKNILIGI